ncbi:hypothetical protein RND71_031611 [Anisodus tanguticus]|uniref:Uncharacterized protein n=1 Tax=Anisodus tanguticus TaxID=243964 RepID=A0AAE1RBM4_9SOLA|nr:hypothetical protein RND71_031611 [Anisodus tanguticus]
MARGLKYFAVLIAINILFSSSLFLNIEARPLSTIEKVVDGLYIEAVKTGGPSSRGEGHNYIDASTLGGIKNSGPSPGMNH